MSGSAKQRVAEFEAFLTGRADAATKKKVWARIERESKPVHKPRPRLRVSRRRLKVLVISTALVAALAGGTWAFLRQPPLIEDNFNDNWPDPGTWRFPRPRVKEQDQHLWLQNRGCVVTQKEFSGPVTISFRWRWIDLAEHPAYAEVLSIALRTSGEMRTEYAYEIEDGLVFTIDTQEGGAYLSYATKGIKPRQRILPSSGAEGRVPLPANEWHDVRIVDDGSTVTLYLRGPATGIGETYWTKPLLQSRVAQTFAGKRIAIYNREVVGDAPHLSQIDDFVVDRASAEPESDKEQ